MTQIDPDTLLAEWWKLAKELKDIKEKESDLRDALFKIYFPEPKVGVNHHNLGNGYDLVGDYKLDVKLDVDEFSKSLKTVEAEDLGLNLLDVVKVKYEFNVVMFKKLSTEKQQFIELFLTRKPAKPTMKIVNTGEK